ncbi:MAG: hypothetical protein H6994_01965 [Pseudomonadales bacterium]|nr:hypothetical protein [Pseudomonadales bacterium]
MYDEIAKSIREGEAQGKKIATFHLEVLMHAEQLDGDEANEFCHRVGVPLSYATEFRKMLSLAQLMRNRGLVIR